MNLSRYYKNAPSFQAEDLVKQTDRTSSGWIPDPRKDQRPFQTQQLALANTARNSTGKEPATLESNSLENRRSNGNKTAGPSQVAPSQEKNDPSVPEESVDLSNFIDRGEAEKIATEAYRQGLEEGRAKAEQDFGAAARSLLLACQQLDTLRATIITNSSKELQDFSLAVAERILRLSVREQDHTIVATIEEALRRAVKSDEFTIHIHPDDYDTLAAKASEIIAGLSGLNNIVIRKDHRVERGGAHIESENCTIDATIAGQFEMIREELKNKSP
jgi:flagellar assembly protein FliH